MLSTKSLPVVPGKPRLGVPFVEVVSVAATNRETARRAAAFVRRIDKLPLPVKRAPGYLANAVLGPYLLEAMRCVDTGVVADEDLADAGVIFDTGFAPFTGGPIHYRKTRVKSDADKSIERVSTAASQQATGAARHAHAG